ncbi:MAG: hypothetical protein WKG01_40405 [Kofleriaceae bacterium]
MRTVFLLGALFGFSSCDSVECGDGTIERDGKCVPANVVVDNATCGPFTELEGTVCVPELPPTLCDGETTEENIDPETGVITCVGTGAGGCTAPFPCGTPVAGKQSICGQLYDLETNQKLSKADATGAPCTASEATGPCAIGIRAYDAIAFGSDPGSAMPLAVEEITIDDCGRYGVKGITVPAGPFIGLGIDDANPANQGPLGITNTVGVTTLKAPGTATQKFEAFVVAKSVTDMWTASGGPPLSGGLFVPIFRAARTGLANQENVVVTRNGAVIPDDDHYFVDQTGHTTIDPAATATSTNGTAIITNAAVTESTAYSAQVGPLPAQCVWEKRAGASLPFIVFVSVFRPANALGMTCPL